MPKYGYKNYIKISLIITAGLLLLTASTNYMIDPYNKMGNNKIGLYHSLDREIKNQITSFKHDAILIGSSKTGRINPDDIDFYKFYNASIDAVTPEEIFFYLKKYAIHDKFVLIGLDFYMFNEREFPIKTMTEWYYNSYTTIEYLLGGKVLRDSKKSISLWLKKQKPYTIKKNGQKVISNSHKTRDYKKIIDFLSTHHYGNFHFSNERMAYLSKTKTLLKDRNIDRLVFINPLHEEVYTALQRLDSYELFIKWKQKLKIIFPNLVDLSCSQYSAKNGFMKHDPYHYKLETGTAFLNKMLNGFLIDRSAQSVGG